MEKLSKKREYLKIILSSYAPLEDGQYLLQRPFEKANNDISTSELRFTYGKANSQALCKAKTKIPSKKHHEMYEVR